MESTKEVLDTFNTIEDVVKWVGVSDVQPEDGPKESDTAAFYRALGVPGNTHWRVLATVDKIDISAMIQ